MSDARIRCLLVLALLTLVPVANAHPATSTVRSSNPTPALVSPPLSVTRPAGPSAEGARPQVSVPVARPSPGLSPVPLQHPDPPSTQINVGGSPEGITYDSQTKDLYVSECYQNGDEICAIDGNPSDSAYQTIVGNVPYVSALDYPYALAYDADDHDVYVAGYYSANLGVVDGNSGDSTYNNIVATIGLSYGASTGSYPNSMLFDPANGYLYVSTDSGVYVVDGNPSDASYRTVLGVISLTSAQGLVYDPLDGYVYVGSESAESLQVISGTSPVGTVSIELYAAALAFNSGDDMIYAASYSGGTVVTIGGNPGQSTYQQVVSTITGVGTDSAGIAFDPATNDVYVANRGSSTISQIDGNPSDTGTYDTVTSTFVEGQAPDGVAVDSADGLAYFSNSASETVGFTGTLSTLTFQESGLDTGTQWEATLDGDQVSSTTSSLSFEVVSGSYSWTLDSEISCGADCEFMLTSSSSGTVSVPSTTSLTATYQKEYYVYTEVPEVSGATPGTAVLEPSSSIAEYVDAGATVEIIATPTPDGGFTFQSFTPSTSSISLSTYGGPCASGSSCESVTVNGAGYITANFAFNEGAPTVTQVSPSSGPTSGETAVTITGTDFYSVTSLYFGTFQAYSYTVNSPTQITVSSSPAGTGVVDVQVTTPAGTSAANPPNDQFTYTSLTPTVSSLYTDNGPVAGGTLEYIYGTNFLGATVVSFGSTSLTASCSPTSTTGCFTVESSTVVYVPSIPAGSDAAISGPVDITVTTPGGTSATSSADQFYYEVAPTVTSLGVTSGPSAGGTTVVITGTEFIGATSVYFGGAYASFTVNSLTQITATSPANVGTVDITVTTPQGTSAPTSADRFTYVSPTPVVTSLSVTVGPAGTGLFVYGSGLTGASQVYFGTTPAVSFYVYADTYLFAVAPAGSGTVDVTVVTPGGTSATSSADQFTYLALTSISKVSGPASGGTLVTIVGSGFTGATSVEFGSTQASFTFVSDSEITATSPAGAGSVYVTVTTPKGTTAQTPAGYFTYLQVTSISPTSGPSSGGTFVTIEGTGFDQAGGLPDSVYFGTTPATSVEVVGDTEITAFSPAGSGTVDVTVVTQYGTSPTSSADQFTYIVPSPTVTGISPSSGPTTGGTSVTITGTSFISVTSVKFGGATATYVVDSATTITATSPAGTGTVDITVTTSYGTSAKSSADEFTYVVLPSVTGISPTSGPASGGTPVTITGSGFTGATAVYFGTTSVGFSLVSDGEITATSPIGTGTVDVTVVDAAGQSPTSSADQFTFVPAISLSSSSGPPSASVTVNGYGFTSGASVSITYDGTGLATSPTTVTVASDGTFSAGVTVPVSFAGAHTVAAKDSNGVTASAIYTITPTVSITPTTGRVGQSISVTGEGFAPGSITLTYDGYGVGTATADSTGSFTGAFDAPASVAGSHEVSAQDSQGNTAAPESYTIKPFITITVVGTVVYVYGYGYAASSPITVDFNGEEVSLACIGSCSSGTDGSFSGSFSLGGSGGLGVVAASDSSNDVASQSTPSVPKPPTLPPTGITVGYLLEVDGTGFAADCGVTIYYDGVPVTTTPPSVVTDDTGSFSATFVVPPSAYGDHTVTATDCLGNTASQTFMVTPLTAVIPDSGDVGQQVELVGSGFAGASPITVTFNGATLGSVSPTTDAFGSFTVYFSIPGAGATHTNTIGATDGAGHSAPGVTFTVNIPSVTSISPAEGASGTTVTIFGSDLSGATAVYFGSAGASGVAVVDPGEVTAIAPSGTGTVDVTVVTPGGTSTTSPADQFTFQVMQTASLSDGVRLADAYTAPATAPLTDTVHVGDAYTAPATAPLTDFLGVVEQASSSIFFPLAPVEITFSDPPGYFLVTPPGTSGQVGCDENGSPQDDFSSSFATVTGCSSGEETVNIFNPPVGTYTIEIFVTGVTPLTVTVETQDSQGKVLSTGSYTAPATETIYSTLGADGSITISSSAPPPGVPEFPGQFLLAVVAVLFVWLAQRRARGRGSSGT